MDDFRRKGVFYFLAPNEELLCQSSLWRTQDPRRPFPAKEDLKHVIRVQMIPGQALVIPSGWIYAVVTVEPSIVRSSSYYTDRSLPRHESWSLAAAWTPQRSSCTDRIASRLLRWKMSISYGLHCLAALKILSR